MRIITVIFCKISIIILTCGLPSQINGWGKRRGGDMKFPAPSSLLQWQYPQELPNPTPTTERRWEEQDYDWSVANRHGQTPNFLPSDDIDLSMTDRHNRCVEHIHKYDYNLFHYTITKNPTLNISVGQESTKCIEIFDIPNCHGMSLQFLNVTRKSLFFNKFGEKEEKERLLNFNVCPKSIRECVPLERYDSKNLEIWKENICKSKFRLEIIVNSTRSVQVGVWDTCIDIDSHKPRAPKTTPTSPNLNQLVKIDQNQIAGMSLSIMKELHDEICLELYTERHCKGEVVRLIVPPPMIPPGATISPPVKFWEYFSNSTGSRLIDTDVKSVRKCAPCLKGSSSSSQVHFPNDAPAVAPSRETSSSTESSSVPASSEQQDNEEDDKCVFFGCMIVPETLNFTNLSDRVIEWNERDNPCYLFFNDSDCSTVPLIKSREVNVTLMEQMLSKHPEFSGWSLSHCDSHGEIPMKCLEPSMADKALEDIFPIKDYVEIFTKDPSSSWLGLGGGGDDKIITGAAGAFTLIVLIIAVIMAVSLWRRKKRIRLLRQRRPAPKQSNNGSASATSTLQGHHQRQLNVHQVDSVHENDYVNDITGLHALIKCFAKDRCELSRESINIGNIRDSTASIIGVGEYSIAFRGMLEPGGRAIAVKTMKSGAATARSMKGALKECQVFMMVGKHPRILEFIGVCTEGVKNGELFVVMEYCEMGALRGFLVQHRSHFVNLVGEEEETIPQNEEVANEALHPITEGPPVKFNTFQLFKWCWEVADALEYLAEKKIVHVSLSSKNVLLDSRYSAKISDFHLAKIPGQNSASGYNRKTATNRLHERHVPWRHFSVESLLDDIFSTQSDIWTFGVFMWEVFTVGSTPYPDYHYGPEFTLCLKHGYRLLKPNYTTIDCYELMLMCWYDAPEKRPTFTKIKSRLEEMMTMEKVHLVE